MTNEPNFDDRESIVDALTSLSADDRALLTSRNALRAIGKLVEVDADRDDIILFSLRAILVASCRAMDNRRAIGRSGGKINWMRVGSDAYNAESPAEHGFYEGEQYQARRSARYSALFDVHSSATSLMPEISRKLKTAASDAIRRDFHYLGQGLHRSPVWNSEQPPPGDVSLHNDFVDYLGSDIGWSFWRKFYEGMWHGTFTNWDIAFKVFLIPGDEWTKGYRHIAKIISEIEDPPHSEALPQSEIETRTAQLLAKGQTAALAAEGTAQLIEMATREYKREISNALPEELQPLDDLPDILRRLSLILISSEPESDKEEMLQNALTIASNTVGELNRRLARAAGELAARDPRGTGRRLFADAFYEKAGERVAELMTSKVLWGGVVAGTGFVLGGGSAEALVDGLQECFQNVIEPEKEQTKNLLPKPK